jgi:hypothetical protein
MGSRGPFTPFVGAQACGMRPWRPRSGKEFDLTLNRAPRLDVLGGKHCAVAAPVGAV